MVGYIKLYRSILASTVFQNEKLLKVFVWCLLKASHKPCRVVIGTQIIELKPGQFVYGTKAASEELGLPKTTFYRYMKVLENLKNVEISPERNFSVATVANWGLYQSGSVPLEYKRNTNGTQTETYNNEKNEKKGKFTPSPPKYPHFEPEKKSVSEPMPDEMRAKFNL